MKTTVKFTYKCECSCVHIEYNIFYLTKANLRPDNRVINPWV